MHGSVSVCVVIVCDVYWCCAPVMSDLTCCFPFTGEAW